MPKLHLANLRLGDPQLKEIAQQIARKEVLIDGTGAEQVETALLDALFAEVPDWWQFPEFDEVIASSSLSQAVANSLTQWVEQRHTRQAGPVVEASPASKPSDAPLPLPAAQARRRRPNEAKPELPLAATHVEVRDQLEELVRRQLLGPWDGENERIFERTVRGRYLVGMLAPRGSVGLPETFDEQDMGIDDGEESSDDATPSKASSSMLPSSIGLSFTVDLACEQLEVQVRWGHYRREKGSDDQQDLRFWQRHQIDRTMLLPLRSGKLGPIVVDPDFPLVVLQGTIRHRLNGWSITLFLVNQQEEPRAAIDSSWLFQPEIVVRAPNDEAIFSRRPLAAKRNELEEQLMAMLYRNQLEFAVGHGVAVEARKADNGQGDRASELRTVVIPSYDVPRTSQPNENDYPLLANLELDMRKLAEVPDGGFGAVLAPLTQAYSAWIESLQARLDNPSPDLAGFVDVGREAVRRCQNALKRIQAGIELLDRDGQVAQAFRFANSAMADQRMHSRYIEAKRRDPNVSLSAFRDPQFHSWRAFQLGFILLNLPSLSDPLHPERSIPLSEHSNPSENCADLLWFPTGGGKTEAYLGLTAFTLAIRRLQGKLGDRDGSAGVAVIMRYTLRLLTLQQFQRAATLICACELLRRQNPQIWGEEPFRIGLWVGQRSTPNWVKDANEAISALRKGETAHSGTPHQLNSCPWCGATINGGMHLEAELPEKGRSRVITYCGSILNECPFNAVQAKGEGLPIMVVDEEIYHRLPSLLIGTVDKFAQMPWNGRIAALFGNVDRYCERHGFLTPDSEHDANSHPALRNPPLKAATVHQVGPLRPPDLIIQDELHLISGPLGTLVGLYETAVDELSSWEYQGRKVRPKLVASTATIRRADQQVHSLFFRKVEIFPPQGLDAGDTFFSIQRPPSPDNPGRRYLGICAYGTRQRTALIQSYVALLAVAQYLYSQVQEKADPYMTLVGYFNTLRDLAAMRRAVEDSVTTRLKKMDERGLTRRFLNQYSITELTSRLSASDIPKMLQRLETSFVGKRNVDLIDVLLATNMISVGVDIGRLGLMVVSGQPKSTAEYIQATSRVGRETPGLVMTVYNWSRPRDLSHYERFEHYHATFYQQVEALSVTPFSPRAIDRGLSGVVVALARLLSGGYNHNLAAQLMQPHSQLIEDLSKAIIRRAAIITDMKRADLVEQSIKQRIDEWSYQIAVKKGAKLGYNNYNSADTAALLQRPEGQQSWDLLTVLNSLRDVESNIALMLQQEQKDKLDEPAPAWNYNSAKP